MSLFAVVPARGGSKRLPGKNLRPLAGRSLLARTADFLRAEGALAEAILSTDDPAIAAAGRAAGLCVPFLRPAELSTDEASSLAVVRHALGWFEASHGRLPELTAVLQVTSPIRRPGLLREAVAVLRERPAAQSVVAMHRAHVPLRYVFRRCDDGSLVPADARPLPALLPTGAMYVTRTAALLAQDAIYAEPIHAVETTAVEAIDIDTEEDFRVAEAILAAGYPWRETGG